MTCESPSDVRCKLPIIIILEENYLLDDPRGRATVPRGRATARRPDHKGTARGSPHRVLKGMARKLAAVAMEGADGRAAAPSKEEPIEVTSHINLLMRCLLRSETQSFEQYLNIFIAIMCVLLSSLNCVHISFISFL